MVLLPKRDGVIDCLKTLWFLLFPEHHRTSQKQKDGDQIEKALHSQIQLALNGKNKEEIKSMVALFVNRLPIIKERLLLDAQAAFERDPAAHSIDEVILSYPGFLALMTHRLAHELSLLKVPLIPRMMSEYAHALTGCDIHPDARIGDALFIDHATGVVVGQTSVIGNRVTIFQGVTLGALAMKNKDETSQRHPTIEDDVVLYSHATILGGKTVIGKRSVIGGSCWITSSVPADSKVILAKPQMILERTKETVEYIPNWDI